MASRGIIPVEILGFRERRELLASAVLMLALLLCSLKLTFGIEEGLDISLYDETAYLMTGLRLAGSGSLFLSGAPDGALYFLHYRLLSLFQDDPFHLYFLNRQVLSLCFTVALFWLFRRLEVASALCAILVFIWLVSNANARLITQVNNFALLTILVFLTAATYCKDLATKCMVVSAGFLAASYARPEFYWSFLIMVVLAGLITIRRVSKHDLLGRLVALCFVLLLGLGLYHKLGWPVDSGRSWIAFSQHFCLNHSEWTKDQANPWTAAHLVMPAVFGDAHNVLTAISNNSGQFLKHVITNAVKLPSKALKPLSSIWGLFNWLSLIAVTLLLAIRFSTRWRRAENGFRNPKKDPFLLVVSVAASLPLLAAVLVIYPDPRYLVTLEVVCLSAAIWYIKLPNFSLRPSFAIAAGLALFLLTPMYSPVGPTQLSRFCLHQPKVALPNTQTIRFVREQGISSHVNVLAAGSYCVYLGRNFMPIDLDAMLSFHDFESFLQDQRINLVVLCPLLATDSRLMNDESWKMFVSNPEQMGFKRFLVRETDRSVLIRKESMN